MITNIKGCSVQFERRAGLAAATSLCHSQKAGPDPVMDRIDSSGPAGQRILLAESCLSRAVATDKRDLASQMTRIR